MNILIFSTAEVGEQLRRAYDATPHRYQITVHTGELSAAHKIIEQSDKLVAVIDLRHADKAFTQLASVLRTKQMKILVLSSNIKQGFDYLSRGASEMVLLPVDTSATKARQFVTSLGFKTNKLFKEYSQTDRAVKESFGSQKNQLIVLGASTGGTEIILKILQAFPKDAPPILIVQHMPPVFTKMYAQRLHNNTPLTVWEAQDGDELKTGLVLLAPGGLQMQLSHQNNRYTVSVSKGELHSGHAPSVDLLFNSVSKICARQTIGVILTGMGADGAQGLLNLRKAGAYTLGQDQHTSIVYGMPKVAYDMGAVMKQGSPDEIAQLILAKL